MTFDDDFVRIKLALGTFTFSCKELGLEWPPPAQLTELNGVDFSSDPLVRVSMSTLTDKQLTDMTHVARGALYEYANRGDES